MRGRATVGTIRWILLSALVLSSLASCGLESIAFLAAPGFDRTGASQVQIVHNTDNDDGSGTFRGYEVLYRLYQNLADANADESRISTYLSGSDLDPASAYAYMTGTMRFVRMYSSSTGTAQPMINLTLPGSGTSYLIDSGKEAAELALRDATNTTTVAFLKRNKSAGSSDVSFKARSLYSIQDQDYSGASSVPDSVHLVMVGVAYGIDLSSATPGAAVYSVPSYPAVLELNPY